MFAFEGPSLLSAALEAGWFIERVFVAPDGHHHPDVSEAAERARAVGIDISSLETGVLEKVADAATPQPCAAIARTRETPLEEIMLDGVVLVLDEVRDPGNLGAVIRVAEATSCVGVYLVGECTDPFGPKALRASAGSAFRLPIVQGESSHSTLNALSAAGFTSFATSSHVGLDFAEVSWPIRSAIVFGNEAAGLSPSMIDACDTSVRIPLAETVESLNLSVAAGILAMSAARGLRAPDRGESRSTMTSMSPRENP